MEIESLLHPRKLSTSSRRNNMLKNMCLDSFSFFSLFFERSKKCLKVLHLVMRKRMRRKPRLALKRLIFFFIFFLLDIYLLQNSLFTSNNISHSNCYVRELSLWKPAFSLRWVFCFFGLSLPSPPMLLLYTFNFLNIVKKSVLQVTFSQQNSCSIE